jgi:hypothetical protein
VPVIGLGWATAAFGLEASVTVFVVVCSAGALVLAAVTLRAAVLARGQRPASLQT